MSQSEPLWAAQTGGAVRLVEHLAAVGLLRDPEDRFFFFCAIEMARIGRVSLDKLLTGNALSVVEMRWVCYYVLEKNGGSSWNAIASRFKKSKDSVRIGARRVRTALKQPTLHRQLATLHRQLAETFLPYQKSLPNG